MLDLELARGVLVDGQRVDDADRVALAEPLELGDDLAVEVRVLEAQHDQLNGSNRHLCTPFIGASSSLDHFDGLAHRPVGTIWQAGASAHLAR